METNTPDSVSRESQNTKILAAFRDGDHLTPIVALHRFQCFRLSGRVKDLRDAGHNIKSRLIEVESGKRVSQYWIDPAEPLITPSERKKKPKSINIETLRTVALSETKDGNERLLVERILVVVERRK